MQFPGRIHGTGILTYHENQENVGKYTSPMDSIGESVSNSTPSFCGMVAVFYPGRCFGRVEFQQG